MFNDPGYSAIGRRQAEARKMLGLTQQELAARIDVPMRTLSDNERGVSVAGGRVLVAYCDLGVRSDWLLTGRGRPFHSDAPREVQNLVEATSDGPIALADFQDSDIRASYLLRFEERQKRSRLSLSNETAKTLCGSSELGLPDTLRLFTVSSNHIGLLLIDGFTDQVTFDGIYLIVNFRRLEPRRIQVLKDGRSAIMSHGDDAVVDRVKPTRRIKPKGLVVGSLSAF